MAPPPTPTTTPPPPQPAALPEELIEEILLRFPPDEPASLFRAALVCKPWCSLISGPRFRRKFRELHRTPPVLGFLCHSSGAMGAHFVPTTAFCPPRAHRSDWDPLDARHGRLLVRRFAEEEEEEEDEDEDVIWDLLIVWDPITDEQRELPIPPRKTVTWAAAVVCAGTATGACDHLDCQSGPFLVVFVGSNEFEMFSIGHPCPEIDSSQGFEDPTYIVLVGKALYFSISYIAFILKYSLESGEMSFIQFPSTYEEGWNQECTVLIEEGVLGLISVYYFKLSIWLMEGSGWSKNRIINLMTLLPHDDVFKSSVVGVADGIVLLMVGTVMYTLDLKTCKMKSYEDRRHLFVVPYMSFYTPELEVACTSEGPSVGASNA